MSIPAFGDSLITYLIIAALLFGIGFYGLVHRRTLIGMLIAGELILAGSSINFMAFNRFLAPDPTVGQIFTLFIMGFAAAEAAIALSIIICVYRDFRTIDVEDVADLNG
jgi:NADH-quinone oxidoreductase subunit K